MLRIVKHDSDTALEETVGRVDFIVSLRHIYDTNGISDEIIFHSNSRNLIHGCTFYPYVNARNFDLSEFETKFRLNHQTVKTLG